MWQHRLYLSIAQTYLIVLKVLYMTKGLAGGDDPNNTKPFQFSKHDEIQTIDMRVTVTVFLGRCYNNQEMTLRVFLIKLKRCKLTHIAATKKIQHAFWHITFPQ